MTKQIAQKELTPRQESLLINLSNLSETETWYTAAKSAGYSEESAKNIKALIKRSPVFLDRLKSEHLVDTSLLLPKINNIERQIVQECVTDIGKVTKYERTLTRINQKAGVLDNLTPIVRNVVNIGSIQVLMAKLNEKVGGSPSTGKPDCVEAEVIGG